jgi:hypothetical protein
MVGARRKIVVAMDWAEFDPDGHATLMLSLISNHGRATPLLWATVQRNGVVVCRRHESEYRLLVQLAENIPAETEVVIVADRAFGDYKLYQLLTEELKFGYVIRFKGGIHVTCRGETRFAADWVGRDGRATVLRQAHVTERELYPVPTIVCVQKKGMKEAWCLAASSPDESAKNLISYRTGIPRCQGFALRHGHGPRSDQHAGKARPALAAQCFRRRATDAARRAGGGARLRPASQIQHREAQNSFPVPAGLYALRTDTDDAGSTAATAHRIFWRNAGGTASVRRSLWGDLK